MRARRRLRRPRGDVRRSTRRADVRAAASRIAASTGCGARARRRQARADDRRRRCSGRGNLPNVLAATAVALEFGVPLETSRRAPATLRPADRRGEVHAPARRRHARRRLVQLEPVGAASARSTMLGASGSAPQGRGARRDARARRRTRSRCTQTCGAAAARAGLDAAGHRRRRRRRGRWPTRRSRGRHAGAQRSSTFDQQRTRPRLARRRSVRAGDLVLVKGSRGIAHGSRRRSAEGGVRLMLYHLLYPLHTAVRGAAT